MREKKYRILEIYALSICFLEIGRHMPWSWRPTGTAVKLRVQTTRSKCLGPLFIESKP